MCCNKKRERALKQFKDVHKKWFDWFAGTDRNSICLQIRDLIQYTAIYQIINESRLLLIDSKNRENKYNGMLYSFIDKCFFEYQFISIRRLLDSGRDTPYSLYGLLTDMENNLHLLTRYNYFYGCDIEYDVNKAKAKSDEYTQEQSNLWKPRDWQWVEKRHKDFDRLSNEANGKRSETDLVDKIIFQNLKKLLDKHRDIEKYTNQYIAHAANPKVRAKKIKNIKITIGQLWEAHKVICEVAVFVDRYFFNKCTRFLDVPQFDRLENIEKPLIGRKDIPRLRKIWDEYSREIDSLYHFDINEYDKLAKSL